jgi:BirA family biotin operon repressor/biotin-[acetyl-CoA-carboxylase] ligase
MSIQKEIINKLKKNLTNWISGENLSQELDVSRTTISKHMLQLIDNGYEIEKSTKKGYRLNELPDLLSTARIKKNLTTKVFGQQDIFYFKEIDSTNTQAKQLATENSPEGTLIIAESQNKGRGRRSRSWFSTPHKNIHLSIILRPKIAPSDAPALTLMTAVALAETIKELAEIDVKIKWPNDLLVNKLKLAGILTEISADMDSIDYIVIGLGLNVNTKIEDFPEELNGIATSIFSETDKKLARANIIQLFLCWFEKYYNLFISEGTQKILKRWKELSNIIGREIEIEMIDKTVQGKVIDLDEQGVLVIEDKSGGRQNIFSGDLKIL